MKNILFLLIIILTQSSCKKQDSELIKNKTPDSLDINSFEYKYKNEPKYFLKFWKGMTEQEYDKVKNLLKKEGVIDFSYDSNGNFFDIKIGSSVINFYPILKKGVVIGVKIPEVDEDVYNLYKEKYKLPKLIEMSTIGMCYKETNPCFLEENCTDYFKIDGNIKEVTLNEVKQNTNFNEQSNIFKSKGLSEGITEIKNNKCNILLRGITYGGSIPLSSIMNKGNHKIGDSNFYYPNNEHDFNSLSYGSDKKTRFRYVVMSERQIIEISYYPNDYFSEIESQKNTEEQRTEQRKKETIKKTKRIINEI